MIRDKISKSLIKENTIEELIKFIHKYIHVYVQYENINLSSKMEKDLGFYGEDIEEFLFDYSNKFNVNIDKLEVRKYFSGEFSFYSNIVFFLFPFLKKYKSKKFELTIADLLKGIIYKRLDDDIIEKELD